MLSANKHNFIQYQINCDLPTYSHAEATTFVVTVVEVKAFIRKEKSNELKEQGSTPIGLLVLGHNFLIFFKFEIVI